MPTRRAGRNRRIATIVSSAVWSAAAAYTADCAPVRTRAGHVECDELGLESSASSQDCRDLQPAHHQRRRHLDARWQPPGFRRGSPADSGCDPSLDRSLAGKGLRVRNDSGHDECSRESPVFSRQLRTSYALESVPPSHGRSPRDPLITRFVALPPRLRGHTSQMPVSQPRRRLLHVFLGDAPRWRNAASYCDGGR